jgi:hypothetical protein
VSFYTPLALQKATVDGQPATFDTATELGRNVVSKFVDIDSGGTATIRLELAGPVKLPKVDAGRRYRLTVWHQPTIEPDQLAIRVSGAGGAGFQDARGLDEQGSAYAVETRPATNTTVGVTVNGP